MAKFNYAPYRAYNKKLQENLEKCHFPAHHYKHIHGQLSCHLNAKGELNCYHNIAKEDGSPGEHMEMSMWVGMAVRRKASAYPLFIERFKEKQKEMERELGCDLCPGGRSHGRDFWAKPAEPVVLPNLSELESLMPQSIELMAKFRDIVIPVMREVLRD